MQLGRYYGKPKQKDTMAKEGSGSNVNVLSGGAKKLWRNGTQQQQQQERENECVQVVFSECEGWQNELWFWLLVTQ